MYNFVGALDFNLKGGVKIKKKKVLMLGLACPWPIRLASPRLAGLPIRRLVD